MDITAQQFEAVLNFKAMADVQDDSVAQRYLVRSNWDVTQAVNTYVHEINAPPQPQRR